MRIVSKVVASRYSVIVYLTNGKKRYLVEACYPNNLATTNVDWYSLTPRLSHATKYPSLDEARWAEMRLCRYYALKTELCGGTVPVRFEGVNKLVASYGKG